MPEHGEVVSVGQDVKGIAVGNKVLFKKWEAIEIKWEREKLLVFEPKNILGILQEE